MSCFLWYLGGTLWPQTLRSTCIRCGFPNHGAVAELAVHCPCQDWTPEMLGYLLAATLAGLSCSLMAFGLQREPREPRGPPAGMLVNGASRAFGWAESGGFAQDPGRMQRDFSSPGKLKSTSGGFGDDAPRTCRFTPLSGPK